MHLAAVFLLPLVLALPAPAQSEAGADTAGWLGPEDAVGVVPRASPRGLVRIGSVAEDRARVADLVGGGEHFPLLRSASTLTDPLPDGGSSVRLVFPEVLFAHDGGVPLSMNEDGRWPGRGAGYTATAGVRARVGPLHLTVVPRLEHIRNEDIPAVYRAAEGSAMQPPWRQGRYSVDLPARYGVLPVTRVDPGETTIEVRTNGAAVGFSTGARWWGPGIRNAIVLSNHAAGIPHLYAGTQRPVPLGSGSLEAQWLVGTLTESPYFDDETQNDRRHLSAAAAVYHFGDGPGLSVGAARAVVALRGSSPHLLAAAPMAFIRWPAADTLPRLDGSFRGVIQVNSLFARWAFPAEGLETYVEWARHEAPASLRNTLVAPHHTQGYTLGIQWARPSGADGVLRMQAEATNLEQSATYRSSPRPAFYTSPSVTQGYTHRGRVLGAAIGPGASSQWLALDWMDANLGVGAFATRVRWENDAYYTTPYGSLYHAHDVSWITGLRAHARAGLGMIAAEVARESRLNFHFQNPARVFGGEGAVDVKHLSLRLRFVLDP